MKELIQIKNLSKKFGKVKALDNINLNIYKG
ncbi:ABC transporter ATP-binding protein, partial [Campylobacter coli]